MSRERNIKRIFLTPMSHCDLGYTDFVADVRRKHVQHLRDVLALCQATENNAEGLKFKWTCEASWTVKEFLCHATETQKQALFHYVRTGQIEIGGFFGVLQFELSLLEELIRCCEYSVSLARQLIDSDGEFTFRYSLTSDCMYDPVRCYRFKQQVLFPEFAQLRICPENVILTGAHLNEDKTVDVRLLEIAGRKGVGSFSWPGAVRAGLTNLAGGQTKSLPVSSSDGIVFPYSPYSLINIRISRKEHDDV